MVVLISKKNLWILSVQSLEAHHHCCHWHPPMKLSPISLPKSTHWHSMATLTGAVVSLPPFLRVLTVSSVDTGIIADAPPNHPDLIPLKIPPPSFNSYTNWCCHLLTPSFEDAGDDDSILSPPWCHHGCQWCPTSLSPSLKANITLIRRPPPSAVPSPQPYFWGCWRWWHCHILLMTPLSSTSTP